LVGAMFSYTRQVLTCSKEDNLGISVSPSRVRLSSTSEDGYTWQVLDDKKYLFSTNLSEHTAKAYKELCDGIGVSFEAVRVNPEATLGQGILVGIFAADAH
jgi:hypothetical protein